MGKCDLYDILYYIQELREYPGKTIEKLEEEAKATVALDNLEDGGTQREDPTKQWKHETCGTCGWNSENGYCRRVAFGEIPSYNKNGDYCPGFLGALYTDEKACPAWEGRE